MSDSLSDVQRRARPFSSRLESLFNSDYHHDDGDERSMLSARSAALSKLSVTGSSARAARSTPSMPYAWLFSEGLSNSSMSLQSTQQKPSQPVVRWLGDWSSSSHAREESDPATESLDGSSESSSPPSPSLHALNEALNETILPTLPPRARLPSSFYASRALSRPPAFLDNLTRSTLPTSSLTCDSSRSEENPNQLHFDSTRRPSPSHSPPTRSSIDSLRTVRDRGLHTSATPQLSLSNPLSWWFQSDSKDTDNLLNEEDRSDTEQTRQSKIRKKYRSPKNPVVFCHGLLGFDNVTIGPSIAPVQVAHWRGIKEVLEANGTEVLITRVPATSSPVDRAKVLEQKVSEVYPGRKVHLIGHSMGGLDCRYLTTHLSHRTFEVLSITTIATPHRGSSFADHFLATVGKERLPQVLSLLDLLPNGGGDGKAFECLTLDSMRKFNEETPDVPGVRYLSWGAVYEPGLIDTWKWPHSVILEREGPNDGLVSVESSKWGTYLGTLSDVNHLDLVGWINTARYKWAEIRGKEIKFKPATFYLGIADYLAWEVEGQGKEEAERLGVQGELKGGKDASAEEPLSQNIGDGAVIGDMVRSSSRGSNTERSKMEKSLVDGSANVRDEDDTSDSTPGPQRTTIRNDGPASTSSSTTS